MAEGVLRPRHVRPSEIADTLTMAGLKLERLHRVGVGDPAQFVVGEVLTAEPHPDADRLTVCSVDVGDGTPARSSAERRTWRRGRGSPWRSPAR